MLPDQRRHLELQIEHYGDGGRGWVLSLLNRRCNIKTKKFPTLSKTHQELNMIYFNCLWDGHLWETSPSCRFKKCPLRGSSLSTDKLTCECVFPCVTTRCLTKSTFTASIFRLKQHSKVVFPASFLRLVPRTYPTLKMADNCNSVSLLPLPPPPPLLLGTSALGSFPLGTFVT